MSHSNSNSDSNTDISKCRMRIINKSHKLQKSIWTVSDVQKYVDAKVFTVRDAFRDLEEEGYIKHEDGEHKYYFTQLNS